MFSKCMRIRINRVTETKFMSTAFKCRNLFQFQRSTGFVTEKCGQFSLSLSILVIIQRKGSTCGREESKSFKEWDIVKQTSFTIRI